MTDCLICKHFVCECDHEDCDMNDYFVRTNDYGERIGLVHAKCLPSEQVNREVG